VIALIDLSRHHAPLREELEAAMARVHDRGWYILGPEVEAFEREFAAYLGIAECVAVGNGTDALEVALRALMVGSGETVATVANAGMYATTAIRAVGAVPAYVEIDASTLEMDPAALAVVAETMPRAIIVTHLYGRVTDVDTIAQISRAHGIPLIEDCAQAHGAKTGARCAGTNGVAGCFSFYPTKNLGALGDAGAVVTDDRELAARLRALRVYGWGAKYYCSIQGGMNSRMDELQAAVLRAKLPHLDRWNRRRREIAARYRAAISHPYIVLPPFNDDGSDVAHLYVVRVKARESLREHLKAEDIATDIHYPIPDHRQPGAGIMPQQGLTRTDRACAEVLSLPCYPELTDDEIDEVAAACNRWQPATRS
jgi:dTDP-4-amino-4,6-dideoxygalactose transaminase